MKKLITILLFFSFLLCGCQSIETQPTIDQKASKKNGIEKFVENNSELEVVYTLVADINGDYTPENFLVTGKEDSKLWYIDDSGNGKIVVDASGCNYLTTELVDRGKEKHIAFMGYYEPSNTNLWVIRLENGLPQIVFEFMADWEIRTAYNRFDMTWKEHNSNPEVGGYDLRVDKYYWDENQGKYLKE